MIQLLLAVINSVLLGIAGTAIATALFYVLVKKAGGLFASLVTYGIPFVALAWGFIFGEKITLPYRSVVSELFYPELSCQYGSIKKK